MAQKTAEDLTELAEKVDDGDDITMTIRVGEQTDEITLSVKYTTPEAPEIGLSLPGDDRQYGKLSTPPVTGCDDTDVRLVTRQEDQHNADVLEMSA